MKMKYRIKSRLRFSIFLVLAMVLTISITSTILGINDADSMTKPMYVEIQIQTGDTLWELAKIYGPNDRDIRKVIFAICEINDISADELQTGQSILIPQYL